MRPGRRTLTVRLIGAIVLVAVVVLGLSYATTYVLVRRELQENALSNLRSRTTELKPLVRRLAGGPGPGQRAPLGTVLINPLHEAHVDPVPG